MPEVVEQLARLTGFRDRDVLDVTLAATLRDLVRPVSITIARSVGEPGKQRWIVRAHLDADDATARSDPPWAELPSLPELQAFPDRARCFLARQVVTVNGGITTSYFPLITEREAIGVLQLETAAPLTEGQTRIVGAILRLYGNFESLLDYGERDTLTGLLNRKTFDESFLRLSAQPERPRPSRAGGESRQQLPGATYWLGVLDIDHFKRVNDGFGHLIGDEVLLLLSRLMRSTFRFQDQLFRFGGEEFVVLMRCPGESEAGRALERLRSAVEHYAFPQVGRITVSVGYTELRRDDSPASAFDRADKAVYFAKQSGRNQVLHFAALVAAGQLADESRSSDIELF